MLAANGSNTSGRKFINKTPCAKFVISGRLVARESKWEVWGETLKKTPGGPSPTWPHIKMEEEISFFRLYPKQCQSLVHGFAFFQFGNLIFMMDDVTKFTMKRELWLLDCNYRSFDLDLVHEVAAHFHAETQEYWAKSSEMSNRVQPTVIKLCKLSKSGSWKEKKRSAWNDVKNNLLNQ